MRILLTADIHSNWPALAAIHESFDVAICLGDVVEYGVEPGPCIDWVREHCAHVVRGNHDHNSVQDVVGLANGVKGFKYMTVATRKLNQERMTDEHRRFLSQMPLTQFITLDGIRMMLVHATPRDPLDEVTAADPEVWARRIEGIDVDVVCVGHTHHQFAFQVGQTTIINPGSIGLQREGDPRAAYAMIDGNKIELRRIDYPINDTISAVNSSPLPGDVKQLLASVYRDGRLPES